MRRSRRISRKSNRKSRRNNTLRKTRRKNTRRVSRRRNTRKNTGRVSRRNTRGVSRRRNIRRRTKRRNTRKVSRKRVIGGGGVIDDIRTVVGQKTCSRKDAEKIKEYFIEAFYSEKIIGETIIKELTEMMADGTLKPFLEAIDNHSKKGKVIVVKSCVDKLDSEGKIEITDTDDETYKITRDKLVEIDEIDELPLKDEVYYLSGDNTEEVENIRDAKDDVVYVTLDNISAYKGTELKFRDPEDTSKSGEYIFPDKTSAGAVLIFIKNKQGTYHFLHQIDEYAWKEFKNSGNYWTVLKGFITN